MADNMDLEPLATEVQETEGVFASFERFVQGLIDRIKGLEAKMVAAPDKQLVNDFASRLDAMQQRMASAMAANPNPNEQPPTEPTGSMGGAKPSE